MYRFSLPAVLAFSSVLLVVTPSPALPGDDGAPPPTAGAAVPAGNYDIREDASKDAKAVLERHRLTVGAARLGRCEEVVGRMKAEKDRLERGGLAVQIGETTGAAELLGPRAGGSLTAPSPADREGALRRFLLQHHESYGLTTREIPYLAKTADYMNPAGNMAWVELKQQIGDIPIFGGEMRAAFTAQGELVRTTGTLTPALDDYQDEEGGPEGHEGPPAWAVLSTPRLSAAEAVALAARSIGVDVSPEALRVQSTPDGRTVVFEPGPFDEEIRVEQQYFPLEPGVVALAWSMTLWQEEPAYTAIVDAETGHLLFRKNITQDQTQPATYRVYNDDSPAPLSPSNALPGSGIQGAPIERTLFTLLSELPAFDNLGWLTDGVNTTTGNNVDAGLDIAAPNGIDPDGRPLGSPFRVFDFPCNAPPAGTDPPTDPNCRFAAVTHLFFQSNRYHDRLYELGFTEAARNFQTDNFGRGGLGNDSVRAEAQDAGGTNNANFATPADGQRPRMQMFIWTGPTPDRDGDFDLDVVFHELTHGTSNRLHNNAGGLNATQSGGMGEGWGDFYGRALLSTPDEDVHGVFAMGAYATLNIRPGFTDNYYYGIRRFPYAVKSNVGANGKPHNPMTFADIDASKIDLTDGAFPRGPIGSATAHEVHNLGEIWAMMLFEVRARIIDHLGFEVGNRRALQIVTDGMKLDPVNPTFLNARDAIIAADCAGFGGADEDDIWAGFATRGMGFGATSTAANVTPITVTESFEVPNLTLGPVTFDDGTCNANGFADPGEDITFHVPIGNPFCGKAVTGITVTLENGTPVAVADIPASGSTTADLRFTVPADAACGSTLTLSVTLNSSAGPVTRTFTLNVGQPVDTPERFDGVTAPALPAGWTTANTGAQAAWVTRTTTVVSAPNAAFSSNAAQPGVNELVSPDLAVTATGAQVLFRNNFNMENGFDGGVLEISIAGADFVDIVDAGGSFVTGGYTRALNASANPLAGRQAWTGTSAGFINTVINLPASATGQSIRLRWRCGTDVGTAGTGWFIDDFALRNGFTCQAAGCQADLALTKTASPVPVVTGSDLTYRIGLTNNGPARATDVVVSDATPTGTTFRSLSSPAAWACTTPVAGGTGAVDCTDPSLEAHDGATFVLIVNVNCALRDGTPIVNSAHVSGSRPDPDGANNAAGISVNASNPAPAISAVSADPSVLWPPNHQFVSVTIDYSVSDNCGPVTTALSVTSNEPPEGKGDGNFEPDWKVVDAHHVLLRAERSGRGNGRIYTITVTSTDSAGGSSQNSTTVTVPHDKGH